MLCMILVSMTVMVARQTYRQYQQEQVLSNGFTEAFAPEAGEERDEGRPSPIEEASAGAAPTGLGQRGALRSALTTTDICLALFMLATIVSCSVFRFHAGACQHARVSERAEVCNHPTLFWLGENTMEDWMSHEVTAMTLRASALILPLCLCVLVVAYNSCTLVTHEAWAVTSILQYDIMATITGCLAGLVGIGGGLIFSPFFLLMGVDPAVAVATSSTCVIFTSSSTTMQYLLTDRVIMSLTLLFGLVNLLASYAGTSFTHLLQDRLATRKSCISLVVLAGVFTSTVLCCIKLVAKIVEQIELSA